MICEYFGAGNRTGSLVFCSIGIIFLESPEQSSLDEQNPAWFPNKYLQSIVYLVPQPHHQYIVLLSLLQLLIIRIGFNLCEYASMGGKNSIRKRACTSDPG